MRQTTTPNGVFRRGGNRGRGRWTVVYCRAFPTPQLPILSSHHIFFIASVGSLLLELETNNNSTGLFLLLVFQEGGNRGEYGRPRGRGAGIHRVRGASGDVLARGPGLFPRFWISLHVLWQESEAEEAIQRSDGWRWRLAAPEVSLDVARTLLLLLVAEDTQRRGLGLPGLPRGGRHVAAAACCGRFWRFFSSSKQSRLIPGTPSLSLSDNRPRPLRR